MGFQEFNFSAKLNYKRTNFFGRKWLFQELESMYLNGSGPLGVLIIGEPGSGKSAIMSQLICSPRSSLLIHNNIIGYHMCDYSEKGKRDGARFVRNLVDQIAGSIPEYSDFVTSNEQVKKVLEKRCESDTVGCFYDAVVGPLRELKNQPNSLKYIFIDALDECLEKDRKSSTILEILKNKLSLFPNWLKIILSSRNWTTVIEKLPQSVKRVVLDPVDERNLEDIHFYIRYVWFQNSFFMDRLLEAMVGFTSKLDGIRVNSLINEMSRNGEGNFLYVKTSLEYLYASEGRINLQSFPTSLYDIYNIYFERQFGKDEFSNYKLLFEVLLAARSPLKLTEIASILKQPTSLLSELLQQVSSFFRFEQDGTVSIYHQSFAEWLENKTDSNGLPSIDKSRGHQNIADNFLEIIEKRNTTPHLQEVTELAVHISLGGMEEKQLARMKRINISNIRDPCRHCSCILHDLAVKNKTAPILDVFIKMFASADVPDSRGMTPAFHAAIDGNVENMKVFINNGIDLNYRINRGPQPITQDPVQNIMQKMFGFNGYGIVHIAAEYGKLKIVRFLIKNGAYFIKPSVAGLTPLHVAARNGHLAVVKELWRYGAKADIIALHHAAARNHTKIVEFLLKDVGLKDKCLPCQKLANISDFGVNTTIQDIHSAFCETALHAAVSKGHLDIVKLLISFGKAALKCKHYSGKTVLMDAVVRNDTEMVELLLHEGVDVDAECGSNNLEIKHICRTSSLFKKEFLYTLYCGTDHCSCGTRAIHLCGRCGLWKMAEKLIYKSHANMLARNCKKLIAPDFAVSNDHADFVKNFNRTLLELTNKFLINKAFINLAVICGSNRTLRLLSDNTSADVIREIYENGRTLLHYAAGWSPYSNSGLQGYECIHYVKNSEFIVETLRNESKKRLITIKIFTESHKNMTWFINFQDKEGRSALHYAALGGFASAVKYFVRHGGDWRIRDKKGNTPLSLALAEAPKDPEIIYRNRMVSETIESWNTTTYDETVAYLISRAKSSIKKCDVESLGILHTVVQKKMPLSLYKLLKIAGVDVNCAIRPYLRPFLLHLQVGDKQVSEIFKIFATNVTVECNVTFIQSELHLMSFFGVSDNVGNFFKSPFNGQSFFSERLAFKNPGFLKNFDQCYDDKGYSAVHRAAEGGNLDALDWFIREGVDISKKSRSGLTALDISIFVLETLFQPVHWISIESSHSRVSSRQTFLRIITRNNVVSKRQRQHIFKKLLLESWKTSKHKGYSSWCNSKLERLSPLHFAGSKGDAIFEFVYKKAAKVIPGLPRNCTNKHTVVPGYLSHLYKPDISYIYERHTYEDTKEALLAGYERQGMQIDDKNLEASLLYPDREAEYHIIYNKFYESPSRVHDINFRSNIRDAVNCSGFYDLLPKRDVLDEKMKQCYSGCYVLTSYVYNYSINLLPFDVVKDCQNFDENEEWSRKIMLMSKLQHFHEKYNFPFCFIREIKKALTCSHECRCTDIKRVLQREFTSRFRENMMPNKFTAKRMGWKDASLDGDVRDRWPFYFFVKKTLNEYNSYHYLETLNNDLVRIYSLEHHFSLENTYHDFDNDGNDTDDIDDNDDNDDSEDDDRHDDN